MIQSPVRTVLLALAFVVSSCGAAFATPLRVGTAAPEIAGQTLDGQGFDLAALRGHVVIVNIWATWCAPCRAEMPTLNAFYLAHHPQDMEMIGASADRPRDIGDVRRVAQGLSYPALILRSARVNELGLPTAVPETIVIDKTGVVRAVITPRRGGTLTTGDLEAVVSPLLRE